MSKIKQDKIPMTLTEDNVFKITVAQGVIDSTYELVKIYSEPTGNPI